jgi:hypothetical protein
MASVVRVTRREGVVLMIKSRRKNGENYVVTTWKAKDSGGTALRLRRETEFITRQHPGSPN